MHGIYTLVVENFHAILFPEEYRTQQYHITGEKYDTKKY